MLALYEGYFTDIFVKLCQTFPIVVFIVFIWDLHFEIKMGRGSRHTRLEGIAPCLCARIPYTVFSYNYIHDWLAKYTFPAIVSFLHWEFHTKNFPINGKIKIYMYLSSELQPKEKASIFYAHALITCENMPCAAGIHSAKLANGLKQVTMHING